MLHVADTLLLCPGLTFCASGFTQVCAFWEYQQPHRIFGITELAQMPLETTFIRLPFSRQKDEVVELSTPAKDRDILQRFFQDDIDAAMHLVSICDPPEI